MSAQSSRAPSGSRAGSPGRRRWGRARRTSESAITLAAALVLGSLQCEVAAADSPRRAHSAQGPGPGKEQHLSELCGAFLEGGEIEQSRFRLDADPTADLLWYLGKQLEAQQLGSAELQVMQTALLEGRGVIHPWSALDPHCLSAAQIIARDAIDQLLRECGGQLDQKKLLEGLKEMLARTAHVRVRREETQEETKFPFRRIVFHPIPPGKFEMGEKGEQVHVELTRPFELMETDVTQFMWVKVMGENPSFYQSVADYHGEESVFVVIKGKSIKIQPDHPVESITWWSAAEYLNRKSIEAGLEPAYNLSRIRWKRGTRAEDGTWEPASDKEASKLKINAPQGDIYRAEGFRFPTEAEWEYIYRNLGKSQGEYPHDLSEKELPDYAWLQANFGQKKHAVGTTAKSLGVNGNVFHDLIGNVWKFAHDRWGHSLQAGVDPSGPRTGSHRVIRGGAGGFGPFAVRSAYRNKARNGTGSSSSGFRPARTLQ